MRHEFFIYYRAPASQAEALIDAVRRMQQTLVASHPGLDARLLRRADAVDGDTTWMEIYTLPAGVDHADLPEAIANAARTLEPWLTGPRHVEHFLPCAS